MTIKTLIPSVVDKLIFLFRRNITHFISLVCFDVLDQSSIVLRTVSAFGISVAS